MSQLLLGKFSNGFGFFGSDDMDRRVIWQRRLKLLVEYLALKKYQTPFRLFGQRQKVSLTSICREEERATSRLHAVRRNTITELENLLHPQIIPILGNLLELLMMFELTYNNNFY